MLGPNLLVTQNSTSAESALLALATLTKKGPPLCKYVPLNSKNLGAVLQTGRRVQNRAQHYFICPSLARFKIQLELFAFRHVFSGLILLWSGKSRCLKGQFFWQPDSLAVVHFNELLINNYIAKGCFRTIFESWLLFE